MEFLGFQEIQEYCRKSKDLSSPGLQYPGIVFFSWDWICQHSDTSVKEEIAILRQKVESGQAKIDQDAHEKRGLNEKVKNISDELANMGVAVSEKDKLIEELLTEIATLKETKVERSADTFDATKLMEQLENEYRLGEYRTAIERI